MLGCVGQLRRGRLAGGENHCPAKSLRCPAKLTAGPRVMGDQRGAVALSCPGHKDGVATENDHTAPPISKTVHLVCLIQHCLPGLSGPTRGRGAVCIIRHGRAVQLPVHMRSMSCVRRPCASGARLPCTAHIWLCSCQQPLTQPHQVKCSSIARTSLLSINVLVEETA
jgi:hypothetical protein